MLLVGREKVKQGASKGQLVPVIKRDIPYQDIFKVSLSTRQVGGELLAFTHWLIQKS